MNTVAVVFFLFLITWLLRDLFVTSKRYVRKQIKNISSLAHKTKQKANKAIKKAGRQALSKVGIEIIELEEK